MKKNTNIDKMTIKGMSLKELELLVESLDYKKFRALQIYKWIYKEQEESPSMMTNLPLELREYLDSKTNISTLKIKTEKKSNSNKTKKIAFETNDGKIIESVSMVDRNRHTVCISSQIGCSVDCKFCATATMGFIRNLSTGEILDQIIMINQAVKQQITNIVFMGMGEPFLNYKNVILAAQILHDPNAFNFGYNRITISTSGILPKIKEFVQSKYKFKLAISLNSVDNLTRTKIMPINKKWPIEDLIKEGNKYTQTSKSAVMYEYVLLKGINDSSDDAMKLAKLLSDSNSKLNIIPYNETGLSFSRPLDEAIERFANIVHKHRYNFRVLVRWSKGKDIDAGCGQLAVNL